MVVVHIGCRGASLATLVAARVVAAFAQARLDPRLLAAWRRWSRLAPWWDARSSISVQEAG